MKMESGSFCLLIRLQGRCKTPIVESSVDVPSTEGVVELTFRIARGRAGRGLGSGLTTRLPPRGRFKIVFIDDISPSTSFLTLLLPFCRRSLASVLILVPLRWRGVVLPTCMIGRVPDCVRRLIKFRNS